MSEFKGGGLQITRYKGEFIVVRVGDVEIKIEVREVGSRQVRLGVIADRELVTITRGECL